MSSVSAAKAAWKALKSSGAAKADVKAAKAAYKAARVAGAADEARAEWKRLKAAGAAKADVKAAKAAYKAAKAAAEDSSAPSGSKRARAETAATTTAPDAKKAKKVEPELYDGPSFDTFAQTPFAPSVLAALTGAGFAAPTPTQARSWPIILSGSDLVSVAKTGSGKTLAFLLPARQRLGATVTAARGGNTVSSPSALVVAPTRELATQILAECVKFMPSMRSCCLYGGVPVAAQFSAMRRTDPHLIVATPGRLNDALERGALTLKKAQYVVLDEADRMLDMGFEPAITAIFKACAPKEERQTLLFSATWPKEVRKLAATFLRNGDATQELFVGGAETNELSANAAVSQRFIHATDDEKDKKLYDELATIHAEAEAAVAAGTGHICGGTGYRIIAFANTKNRVDKLTRLFWDWGYATCSVHGGKTQPDRASALKSFMAGEAPIMFATDVAARGLHIDHVTHVVNFDMARDVESYVHRIGRTGRAGTSGQSITFWNPDYDKLCAPALVKIARDAKQDVPEWLAKYAETKASKQWKLAKAVLPPAMLGGAQEAATK